MEKPNHISRSGIFFSCTGEKHLVAEYVVPEHVLTHVYEGKLEVTEADKTYTLHAGETGLFTRNQLAKFTKYPTDGAPFKSATVFFTQDFLQKYYSTHSSADHPNPSPGIKLLHSHPLLKGLFTSLTSYFDMTDVLPAELAEMKLVETMTILRSIDKGIDSALADFTEPGKIDLADFMQKNFMFNISLKRFAYLTGRSLATFKRDFQKVFQIPPQRWLLQKRLKQAHFLIAEKQLRPSEAYMEVGFENLSHFSYSFKQMFGYPPSSISMAVLSNPI